MRLTNKEIAVSLARALQDKLGVLYASNARLSQEENLGALVRRIKIEAEERHEVRLTM